MTIRIQSNFRIKSSQTFSESGTVFALDPGVELFKFINQGRIEALGEEAIGIRTSAPEGEIQNGGTIIVQGNDLGYGIYATEEAGFVLNKGSIVVDAATAYGVRADAFQGFSNQGSIAVTGSATTGLYFGQGGLYRNMGSVSATGSDTAVGVYIGGFDGDVFTNEGVIRAVASDSLSVGLRVSGMTNTPVIQPTIINRGEISGDFSVYSEGTGGSSPQTLSDSLANYGTLQGDIYLGRGDDRLQNFKTIVGDINMGDGADRVDLTKGRFTGEVSLGAGNDTLYLGRNGSTAFGGDGLDLMEGGKGADTLYGGVGDDELHGGGGDDVLTGGAGLDRMAGDDGRNTFVWTTVTDSPVERSDYIYDLQDRRDWIDLSAIDGDVKTEGVQGFQVVDAFSGHAGELVLSYNHLSDVTSLTIDVNGDGIADMLVRISDNHEGFDRFIFGGG